MVSHLRRLRETMGSGDENGSLTEQWRPRQTTRICGFHIYKMVSLSEDQGSGAFYFNRQDSSPCPSISLHDEDLRHETSSLGLVTPDKFRPIPTTWIAIIQLLLIVTFEVLVFVFSSVMHLKLLEGADPPFNFLVILHVVLWLFMFFMDRILQWIHHVYQRKGFLEFFRKTKNVRRLPFFVLSTGNAVLLVIYSLLGDHPQWSDLSLVNILQIIFSAEFLCMFPAIIHYLVLVVKFNKSKPPPDAEDPGVMNGFTASDLNTSAGFRDSEYLDEVLEKQADMIRYLQQHNVNLGKRLLKLVQQQQQTAA